MGDIYHQGSVVGSNDAIDDTKVSNETTWSSSKIDAEIDNINKKSFVSYKPVVDLSTQTLPYTLPSDGYISINTTSTSIVSIAVGQLSCKFLSSTGVLMSTNWFMKKGQKVTSINNTGSSGSATDCLFLPINYDTD